MSAIVKDINGRRIGIKINSTLTMGEKLMESIYKIVELVGTSEESWEDAVNQIIAKAATTLRDLRIAEVVKLDVKIEDGKGHLYRAKVKLSFKFEK